MHSIKPHDLRAPFSTHKIFHETSILFAEEGHAFIFLSHHLVVVQSHRFGPLFFTLSIQQPTLQHREIRLKDPHRIKS